LRVIWLIGGLAFICVKSTTVPTAAKQPVGPPVQNVYRERCQRQVPWAFQIDGCSLNHDVNIQVSCQNLEYNKA